MAKETRILFIHSEATVIAEKLSRSVFKGLQVKLYDCGLSTAEHLREKRVKKIVDFLRATEEDRISVRFLKNELALGDLSKGQMKTIYERVEEILSFEWDKDMRSWKRCKIYPEAPQNNTFLRL